VSRAGQVDGAGSREDSLEFGGPRKVESIDPDGPARTSLPAMDPDLAPCKAGTAGLREYLPHNQGKALRGNRDSEGPSKQRPRPGSCDRKSLGRGGVTRRSKARTGFRHPGPTPASYGLVLNPLHVPSLLFFLSQRVPGQHLSSFTAASVYPT
jgi:hypothetical protein